MRKTATPEIGNQQYAVIAPTLHCAYKRATENTIVGERSVGDTRLNYEELTYAWFDYFLKGENNRILETMRLYRRMFQDMLDAQTEQGEVPLLAPGNENYSYVGKPYFKPTDCCGATPAWDSFWFVIPWESWMRYGDRRALEKTYPAMRKYLDEWIPRWTNTFPDRGR